MKIGVDARALEQGMSGVPRHILGVVQGLSNKEANVVLYSWKPLSLQLGANVENVSCTSRAIFFRIPYVRTLFWFLLWIPKRLKMDRIDLFWSTNFTGMGRVVAKQVITVLDLAHQRYWKSHGCLAVILHALFFRPSLRQADRIIVSSEGVKNELVQRYQLQPEKIFTVPLAPSLASTELLAEQVLAKVKKYILYTGFIIPRKNLHRLMQAYERLPDALRKECPLVFTGRLSSHSKMIYRHMQRLMAKKELIYLGHVKDGELAALIQGATCLAYPSIYEGFGLPIVEAMRLKTPVLTSQDPACAEVAGDAAVIVDPYSVDSIAEGLRRLVSDAALREELSRKGYERSLRYSWERTAEGHLACFRGLV
jgi:glycosyltransferase involved in cell wall biosynthesis